MAVESISTIKSYLAEGKCPTASELVDVIDTLVSICQNSGGSVSYNHLELVPDLDAYTEAPVGKIVKYNGQTGKYTRGWDYECVIDRTIGTPTISWQPIIMPSSIQTDVELSSSSHYPVENATLYDELRVEEAGSVLSVNGTNYPIVELDATDFDSIVYTGAGDTDFTFKVIPTLDSNKAYIIRNADFVESDNNYYSFSNQGTFIVKFQPSGNLGQYTSIAIGHNDPDNYNYYQTEGTEFNEWLSIPATYQFNVTDWGGSDNDTTIPYYGTSYEAGGNPTITKLTNATETTGSASVIKSLKAKVMELEAQIAQISAQLQNIASN